MNATCSKSLKNRSAHVICTAIFAAALFMCLLQPAGVYADTCPEEIPSEMLKEQLLPDDARTVLQERIQTSVALAAAGATQTVALIIDNPVFPGIAGQITQYIEDVESRFPVELLLCTEESWRTQSHTNLRQYLRELYTDHYISGAVLVGFYPYMRWKFIGDTYNFPVVLNYMDLDGAFEDTDHDGFIDSHTWGGNGMEIWVSLIWPYQESYTSTEYTSRVIDQLKTYFEKTHKYYTKQLIIPHRAFVYANYPWAASPFTREHCYRIFGTNGYGEIDGKLYEKWGNGHDYINARAGGCEFLNIWCHSSAQNHYFDQGPHRLLPSSNISDRLSRGSVISFLYNCFGLDFQSYPQGCFGQRYSFEGIGQVAVGNTRSIGIVGQADMVGALSYGTYMGEAYYEVLNAYYESKQGFDNQPNTIVYGQTMMGNPFVYLNTSNNLSAVYGSVAGRVLRPNGLPVAGAKVTVVRDEAVHNITCTDTNGVFFADYIGPGEIAIQACDRNGVEAEALTVTLAEGEASTNNILRIKCIAQTEAGCWRYLAGLSHLGMLPADWNEADCDTSGWGTGQPPYLRHYEGEGTELDFAPFICLRRNFQIDPRTEKTLITVSADTGIELYVNGSQIPVHTGLYDEYPRTNCNYWNYSYDVTGHTVTGENYVVIRSWSLYRPPPWQYPPSYLDATVCCILPEVISPTLKIEPQIVRLTNFDTGETISLKNAGTGNFSYTAIETEACGWLSLSKTNGTVYQTDELTLTIDTAELTGDVYYAHVAVDAGAAGSDTITVIVTPMSTLYETHFAPPLYSAGEALAGQDGWSRESEDLAYIIEDPTAPDGDGHCLYIDYANHYYHDIDPLGVPYIRYSAYFNLLPEGNNHINGIEFRMAKKSMIAVCSDKTQGCCYMMLRRKDGSWLRIYNQDACTGEWIYVSYLMEFKEDHNCILEAQIGSLTTNFAAFESFMTGYPAWIDLKAYVPAKTNVAVKVDALKVTVIPEPVFATLGVGICVFLIIRMRGIEGVRG